MNVDIKLKWMKALNSGDYTQGFERLVSQTDSEGRKHCCLGVLCELHKLENGGEWDDFTGEETYLNADAFLPEEVAKWAGFSAKELDSDAICDQEETECFDIKIKLPDSSGEVVDHNCMNSTLSKRNDAGVSFARIADLISINL